MRVWDSTDEGRGHKAYIESRRYEVETPQGGSVELVYVILACFDCGLGEEPRMFTDICIGSGHASVDLVCEKHDEWIREETE